MKSEKMNAEIKKLKNRVDATKNSNTPWFTQAVEGLGNDIVKIVTAPVRFVDNIVSGVLSLFS